MKCKERCLTSPLAVLTVSGLNLWSASPTWILCVTAGGIPVLVELAADELCVDERAGEDCFVVIDVAEVGVFDELDWACTRIEGVQAARTARRARRRMIDSRIFKHTMLEEQLVVKCLCISDFCLTVCRK